MADTTTDFCDAAEKVRLAQTEMAHRLNRTCYCGHAHIARSYCTLTSRVLQAGIRRIIFVRHAKAEPPRADKKKASSL